jgi:hypothetical protein
MTTLRLILIAGASLLVLLLGLVFTRNLIDFPVYYAAGQSLLSGRTDLYSVDFARGAVMDYRYPPFFLVSFSPLWLLSYSVSAYIWYLLSIGQIAVSLFVLRRLIPDAASKRWVWLVSLLISAQYLVMILHYGNAHLLATTLAFAGLYLAIERRHVPAGLLLAIAITIKLTPLFVLPYFVVKRQWRTLGLLVVFLAALNLAPSAYFGLRGNAALLAEWYGHVIADQQFHEENGPINLSLKGQLKRYFSEVDYARRVDGDTSYPSVSIASVTPSSLDAAWLILSGATFVMALALIKWRAGTASEAAEEEEEEEDSGSYLAKGGLIDGRRLEALEIAFLICLMLFIGPLTSKIYFIALLWPLVCVASFDSVTASNRERVVRVILYVLCAMNLVLPLLPGRSIQRLLLVLGADFYLNLLLLFATGLAWFSFRRKSHLRFAALQEGARSTARSS